MRLRNLFVLGTMALSLALPQLALSADSKDGAGKAKIDETKHNDRGVAFTPINEAGSVQPPITTPVVKKTDSAKTTAGVATKKSTDAKVIAKVKVKQPVLTAVHKPKSEIGKTTVTAHTNKTVAPVGHPTSNENPASEIANTNSQKSVNPSMLVKFTQADGGAVISARLDHSGTLPSYKVGDKMTVNVKANQDCNVVVFNYDSTGTLTQIFPNDYQQNGFLKSGEGIEIGGADSPFDYQIAGKGGPEKVFVYAYPTGSDTKNPLTAMGTNTPKVAMAPIAGTPFRGGEMTVDEYRKMVNSSQVFFSRSVEVKARAPRSIAQNVSSTSLPASSPNKVELTFTVDK